MKELTVFMLPHCPHCRLALACLERLQAEDECFRDIAVKLVDESREAKYAEGFDYYFVPSFYYNGEKLHEGHAEYRDVKRVLEAICLD